LIRDMTIVAFGANRATDSFWTAFRVPNVFRRLFGEGALSAAFVPVFTETAEHQGWEKARIVLANCAGVLAILLGGIVVLIELGLVCALIFFPGQWDRTLLLHLTMIVLPFMITICLLALGSAGLNCKGHFAYPAFAPIILNVFLIAGAGTVLALGGKGQSWGLFALCGSVLAAGVVQLIGVIWLLRRVNLAALPTIRPLLAETRRIAALTIPMMIPMGLTQLSSLFESFYAWFMTATQTNPALTMLGHTFARPLEPGVVTCLYAAERLYNFPLGIFAISLGTAVFPLLSRYAARGDTAALRETTNRSLRASLFLGIPPGVALMILAKPAAVLIYRHGDFTPADAGRSALILQMYCLGMWAYFARHILLRAFFAQKDVATPLKISCILAVANILLVAVLVFTPLGAGGIGLATAITAAGGTLLFSWVLHRRWGKIGLAQIVSSLVRILIATGLMGATIATVQYFLAPGGELTKRSAALSVTASVVSGGIVFLTAAVVLRCRELPELWGALRGRTEKDTPREERV